MPMNDRTASVKHRATKYEGRRKNQRLREEVGVLERDTLAFRYAPFNYWFEDEESLFQWFEGW